MLEPLAADLGWILHWPLSDVERLTLSELKRYHALAAERLKWVRGKRG